MNQIDEFFEKEDKWKQGVNLLRSIVLMCSVEEIFKWRAPCYAYRGKNICIIGKFKEHFVLSFFKGVLLSDEGKLLVLPGENSHSVKMFKFFSLDDVKIQESKIKEYIFEAIEIEKAGVKIEKPTVEDHETPIELEEVFSKNKEVKEAWEKLTPGRKRAYLMFFSAAKQSSTKTTRINKYVPRILIGKGMNDCVCGLSKRMPNCDGSHKTLKN